MLFARAAATPAVPSALLPAAAAALPRLARNFHLLARAREPSANRLPREPSGLQSQRRNIVVGRDQGNFNSVVLMVPQAEEWMVERFGRYNRTCTPGLNFAIPFLESVAYKRTLKESTITIRPQTAITKDNVHVQLDGAVYTKVEDSYKASYGVADPGYAIDVLAQSAMRKEVGNLELDQLFLEREKLNAGIALALDEAASPWGIRVFRYEIADIHVDRGTREAMEKQSNAERLRRAEVLESEGYRQRLINQSEGERQSAINSAQGEAEAIRLSAQANADSIKLLADAQALSTRMHAEATADGLRAIATAIDTPGGRDAMVQRLAEKYVGELAEMAKQSNLVIVPDRPNDVSSVIATAMAVGGANTFGGVAADGKAAAKSAD